MPLDLTPDEPARPRRPAAGIRQVHAAQQRFAVIDEQNRTAANTMRAAFAANGVAVRHAIQIERVVAVAQRFGVSGDEVRDMIRARVAEQAAIPYGCIEDALEDALADALRHAALFGRRPARAVDLPWPAPSRSLAAAHARLRVALRHAAALGVEWLRGTR